MEEQNTQSLKLKSKKKKIFILLVIDFFGALFFSALSVFKKYDPNAYCQPPECLGQHALKYYGYPFKYLQFKPSGFDFYFDKFLYNFIIYLLIVFVVSLLILFIINKIGKKK